MNKDKNQNSNVFIWVMFLVVIVLVFLFPKIYSYIETMKLPEVQTVKEDDVVEKKEVTEEVLNSLHFPKMRSSIYDINTYYTLDEFTINNLSNNDILYNAFMDLYEGNITDTGVAGTCTQSSKQFSSDFMELRIKNILGKNINYSLGEFYVPEDSGSSFVGTWNYDSINSRFIYNGLCSSKVSTVRYYNLEQLIKAEYVDKDIVVYYYVGFAKIEGNSYVIYSDPNMQNEIISGEIGDVSEINSLFNNLSSSSKKIYKFVFKNTLCSYNEYCLYKGEWVNEL